jgi:transcriptional regulator with XRE-family HTH domain
MIIGDRLRALREEKKLSQGDIEKRTGLLRCSFLALRTGIRCQWSRRSRSWQERWRPLYQLFYESNGSSETPSLGDQQMGKNRGRGSTRKEARLLGRFRRLLSRIGEDDRELLLLMAQRMIRTRKTKGRPALFS